jgi:hypothetical protein
MSFDRGRLLVSKYVVDPLVDRNGSARGVDHWIPLDQSSSAELPQIRLERYRHDPFEEGDDLVGERWGDAEDQSDFSRDARSRYWREERGREIGAGCGSTHRARILGANGAISKGFST